MVDAYQPGSLKAVDTTHVPPCTIWAPWACREVTAWYGLVKIAGARKATPWWSAPPPRRGWQRFAAPGQKRAVAA